MRRYSVNESKSWFRGWFGLVAMAMLLPVGGAWAVEAEGQSRPTVLREELLDGPVFEPLVLDDVGPGPFGIGELEGLETDIAVLGSYPKEPIGQLLSPKLSETQGLRRKQVDADLVQIPSELTGTLTDEDTVLGDGRRYDLYRLEGQAGEIIKISLTSGEFDTYLVLLNENQETIDSNDDFASGNTDSQIVFELPAAGSYYVAAGAYDASGMGQYQLTMAKGNQQDLQRVEADRLNQEGVELYNQDRYLEALERFEQSLSIREEIGDRRGVGLMLNNIGGIYDSLGEYAKALERFEQSLSIREEIGDRRGVGASLNNIGFIYSRLGEYAKALDYYEQSLSIREEIGDRRGVGASLNNIGGIYDSLGEYAKALERFEKSLSILEEIGDQASRAITLGNIGDTLAKQDQPELAIIFLKRSVSLYEAIRGDIVSLDDSLQASYTDSVADTYRQLADLLLQENRVLEAQAVLDLLRTQELEEYFQDVRSSSTTTNDVDYWKPEENILALYQQFLSNKIQLAELRARDYETLSLEERQRLSDLQSQENQLTTDFNDFIERADVQEDVATLRKATTGDIELDTLTDLQNNIANLPNALVIYPLIFEDRLEIILVPSDAPPIRRRVEVTSTELNKAILDYRTILRNPNKPAKPAAQTLYNWLIAEIEPDLEALGTKTIVYSPDGALRYIPLAALHDGRQWGRN